MNKTAYLIQKFHDGFDRWCSKHDSLADAVNTLCALLPGMTSPDGECDCGDETQKKVRSLIQENKYCEAIRAWNNGDSDTKFFVHKIAMLQENCQDVGELQL